MEEKYCVVRDRFLMIYQTNNNESLLDVIALQDLIVFPRREPGSKYGFEVINSSGLTWTFEALNENDFNCWMVALKKGALGGYLFQSFAPTRNRINASWYINARDYFTTFIRAMKAAKLRVFITDWYLSEELYLERPKNEQTRLDNLLLETAKRVFKVLTKNEF